MRKQPKLKEKLWKTLRKTEELSVKTTLIDDKKAWLTDSKGWMKWGQIKTFAQFCTLDILPWRPLKQVSSLENAHTLLFVFGQKDNVLKRWSSLFDASGKKSSFWLDYLA